MIIITIIINSNNNKNKNKFQKKWLLREDLVAPKCKATFFISKLLPLLVCHIWKQQRNFDSDYTINQQQGK